MQFQKLILVIVVFFAGITFTAAQSNTTIVKGAFKEGVHAEISITEWADGKPKTSLKYSVNPAYPNFAFSLPVNESSTYKLFIRLMEQGKRRMEPTKQLTFPLQLAAGQNITINVTPSKLDTLKKGGLDIKNAPATSSLATVKGALINWTPGLNISLARVVDGSLEEVSSVNFFANKEASSFLFTLPVREEGFYYLVTLRWRARIYLKPSEKIELTIDAKTGVYDVINASEENRLLSKWQKLALPITELGYTRNIVGDTSLSLDDYLSRYEKLQPAISDFVNHSATSNAKFNRLFELASDIDKQLAPIYFLAYKKEGYRPGFGFIEFHFKGFQQVPGFYKRFIERDKFPNADILKIGEARQLMNMYAKLNLALESENKQKDLSHAERLHQMINTISNDTLKAFFLKDQMGDIEINNLTEFRKTFTPFKRYAKLPAVKQSYERVYGQFIGDTAWLGKSSYNFSLPDITGKMVSMKDFKGKVILIDVWATWCGPCKEQMPSLKEIEEEYKDNRDIVFIGISIDKEKDKQKWLNYIKKEGLHGVQLFDDVGKSFAKEYEINAIPRFLLIDKQGNWIEVRCPMPADKKNLKKYLDEALGNKTVVQTMFNEPAKTK